MRNWTVKRLVPSFNAHYLRSFVMWLQNNQLILSRWPHLFALSLFFFTYLNHILSWADDKLNINWKFYMHCSFPSSRINHSDDCFSASFFSWAQKWSSELNILCLNCRNPWCDSQEKNQRRKQKTFMVTQHIARSCVWVS